VDGLPAVCGPGESAGGTAGAEFGDAQGATLDILQEAVQGLHLWLPVTIALRVGWGELWLAITPLRNDLTSVAS